MRAAKRKSNNKSLEILDENKGESIVKLTNLDIPFELQNYLFRRFSKLKGFLELSNSLTTKILLNKILSQ